MTHLFCFGLGFSAGVVARRLAAEGWRITGTARTHEGAARLSAEGFRGLQFDGTMASREVASALEEASHVLLSIPPNAGGDPALQVYRSTMEASPALTWIGYFSTVGVYGDAAGGWVSEDTETRPNSERGRRRLAAEMDWLELGARTNKTVMVFRLPGIYGPGRSTIDDLKDGSARRIVKPGQVFNRIHVDDIATAVTCGIARPRNGGIYNVTDDEPGPPQDVVEYGAALLGVPPPPTLNFATAELSPMARSFYSESKRVSNMRMKMELGVRLRYPTYREGLASLVDSGLVDSALVNNSR